MKITPLFLLCFVLVIHLASSFTPILKLPHAPINVFLDDAIIQTAKSSCSPPLLALPGSSDGQDTFADVGTLKKKRMRSFDRYLEVECWSNPHLRGLEKVLSSCANACMQISKVVSRAATDDIYGVALSADGVPLDENVQGETQQKLDVVCNEIMLRAFCGSSDNVAAVASEEEDEARLCNALMDSNSAVMGEYVAVFDPLDGSKNIDSSLPVGTIFGIYRYKDLPPAGTGTFLQPGCNMVASGYCLYSATTVLVLTMGNGVDGFTLDPDKKEFLQTHPDMRIPAAGPIVSFNEANFNSFDEPVKHYLRETKSTGVSDGKGGKIPSQGRYIGALVADIHNVLIQGGIYGYPSTRKNLNGKIRLLYESNPIGLIIEQAGGAASTGRGRILDVKPEEIHQRTPTFLGSLENVFELEQCYQYVGDD